MSAKIEKSLRERFDAFAQTTGEGDKPALRAMARGVELDAPRLESHIGTLADLSALSPATTAEVRDILRRAAELLPEPMWASVIVECDDEAGLKSVKDECAGLGAPVIEDDKRGSHLRALGMVALRVPPFPGVLNWLGERKGVKMLGDGDRKLKMLRAPQACIADAVQPWDAVVRAMSAEDLPEDSATAEDAVTVAVIDAGIDAEHPGLAGRVIEQFDLSMGQLGAANPSGHGTHVAGIIAGAMGEFRGVAPHARLIDVNVFDNRLTSSLTICEGIGCAVEAGADIINLSLGGSEAHADGTAVECRAVARAAELGCIVCVAAGNEEDEDAESPRGQTITIPGDAREAVTVAATHLDGRRAAFSSTGPTLAPERTGHKPNVAAPGVGILSFRSRYCTTPPADAEGLLVSMNGTSMATPLISGLCALGLGHLRSKGADATAESVVAALEESATDPLGQGEDQVGAGVPRVPQFLQALAREARASGARTGRRRKAKVVTMPTSDPSDKRVLRAASTESRQDAASKPKEDGEQTGREYAQLEKMFLHGVNANVRRHGRELAGEVLARRCPRLRASAAQEDDEIHRIRDKAHVAGLALPAAADDIPANRGLTVTFEAKRFLWRGRKVMHVVAKSFAGEQFIRGTQSRGKLDSSVAADFVKQKLGDSDLSRGPVVFALFAPCGWDVSGLALTDDRAAAVTLCSASTTPGDLPFGLAGSEYGWYMWLALTPIDMPQRIGRCTEALLKESALDAPGRVAEVNAIARRLKLPDAITERLVEAALGRGDKRFVLRGSPGDRSVERVSMI